MIKPAHWLLVFACFLAGCGGGYRFNGNGVAYLGWNKDEGRFEYELPGVDPHAFVILDKLYAKDAERVYFEGHVIERADPATFTVVGRGYGKDARRVFLGNAVLFGADPATFRLLSEELCWGVDAQDAYFGNTPAQVADPAAFQIVQPHWGRDGRHYYTDIGVTVGFQLDADYGTLRILNTHYAKDRAHAFYGAMLLPGADVATFVVVDEITARDAHATYVLGRRQ